MNQADHKGSALITGASSGIGKVYAERLAQDGYDLFLVARRVDRLHELAERINDTTSRKVVVLRADLTSRPDLLAIENLFQEQEIALVVNNAGAGALGPLDAVDVAILDDAIQLNVVALTRLCHAALTLFRQRNFGTIVNIASVIALRPASGAATYSGSKAFVLNFSRSLQLELASTDVLVQVVLPGPVSTEFFKAAGVSEPPFPEHLFMSAEDLVDAALQDLKAKELISIPVLQNFEEWRRYDGARANLIDSLRETGSPGVRYSL